MKQMSKNGQKTTTPTNIFTLWLFHSFFRSNLHKGWAAGKFLYMERQQIGSHFQGLFFVCMVTHF